MFEITRTDPFAARTMRELISTITHDPLFRLGETAEEVALALDVSQGDGELIVRASLPGFKKSEIDIQVHQGILSIKAEHEEDTETKTEKFYRRERRIGMVSRRIDLPGVVSESEAKAELKDGVLTIRIPQAQEARPKQIAVK